MIVNNSRQFEQNNLFSPQLTEYKQKTNDYDVGNPNIGLRQAEKCDGVKLVNVISTLHPHWHKRWRTDTHLLLLKIDPILSQTWMTTYIWTVQYGRWMLVFLPQKRVVTFHLHESEGACSVTLWARELLTLVVHIYDILLWTN